MSYGRYGSVPFDAERQARMNVFKRMANARKDAVIQDEIKTIEDYATMRTEEQNKAGMWGGGIGGILGYVGTDLLTDVALNTLLTVGTGGFLNPANPMTQMLIKGGKAALTAGVTAGAGTGFGAKLGTDLSRSTNLFGGEGNVGYTGPQLKYSHDVLGDVNKNIKQLGEAQSINNFMTGMQVGTLAHGGMEKFFGGDAVGEEAAKKVVEDTASGEVEKVVGEQLMTELQNAPKSVVDNVMKSINKGKMLPGVDTASLATESPEVIKAAVDVGLKNSPRAINLNTAFNKSYGDILTDMGKNIFNRFDMNKGTTYEGLLGSLFNK